MTPRFSFTVDGRRYSFVDEYQISNKPLPGDYVTYPIFSGMRSSCMHKSCSDCVFDKVNDQYRTCNLPLIHSPHIANLIPDHIKQSFPEYFI